MLCCVVSLITVSLLPLIDRCFQACHISLGPVLVSLLCGAATFALVLSVESASEAEALVGFVAVAGLAYAAVVYGLGAWLGTCIGLAV